MNACHRSTILVIHFIVGSATVLVAKLGTRRGALLYKGEWAYCTRSEAFKDKARLRLHSKGFGLKKFKKFYLKYKASFILKFKAACIATRTLVINYYSRELCYHNCSIDSIYGTGIGNSYSIRCAIRA